MHTNHAADEKTVNYPADLAGQASDDLSHLQELFGTNKARQTPKHIKAIIPIMV